MDIEQAFNITFKLIFGECNLKLDDLEDYLKRWHYPTYTMKSDVSGKTVTLSTSFYGKDAKYISQEELDFKKKYELDINKIRDIDSILEQIQDRIYYAGNKSSGNSGELEESDVCTDANYVYRSHNVAGTKYAAYCSYVRYGSEYVFGSGWFLRSKYLIRCMGADNLTRSFEAYVTPNCSDAFFCFNCWASTHLMFSFNQRSKRYCIGNNELPKDRYFELRKKLVNESREYLEKHKTFPSMFELKPMDEDVKTKLREKAPKKENEEKDLKPINEAFGTTARVILGKEIGDIEQNKGFLCERPKIPIQIKTFFGNPSSYSPVFLFEHVPKDRMICREEEYISSEASIQLDTKENLGTILDKIRNIALFRVDMSEGNIKNVAMSPLIYHAINGYYVGDLTYGKNCAYCTFALNTEAVFGSFRVIHSNFCIRCENPYNCTACFECDACTNCSNCLYCHNCEGCNDCMFCFNAKSLRYAIGNVEIGREKYLEIKKKITSEIVSKLENDKKLDINIYNLGCRGNTK